MKFRIFVGLASLFFASTYGIEGVLFRDYNQDEFQVATGYLKDRDPTLFQNDFIWSKPEMISNLHVCVRTAMDVTNYLTCGLFKEPIDLFLFWLPICIVLFFVGNYLLCLKFTSSRWASLLVTCSLMIVRRTIWDWWGLGPMFTMSARGLVLTFLPLGLWAYFQYQDRLGRLACCFLIWGCISNLHPLSGWGFVEFLGITILICERFRFRAWIKVAVIGITTLIGSIPFLVVWNKVVIVPEGLQADPMVIKHFWKDFTGLTPPSPALTLGFLEDIAIPLLLAIAGFWVWRQLKRPGDTGSMKILSHFPFVVISMTILVMVTGYLLQYLEIALPIMVPEHSRNIKLIYLTIPVWMAFAFVGWFRKYTAHPGYLKFGIPILVVFVSIVINLPGHKLARRVLHLSGWLPNASQERLKNALREDHADLEVALWARANTSRDALFYFDSYEFRYYAQRSLVFCWFDRPCVAYRPTKELEEWIQRRERLTPIKKAGNSEAMLAAAGDYHANYLVLLNSWKPLKENPVWSNWKYSVYQVRDF